MAGRAGGSPQPTSFKRPSQTSPDGTPAPSAGTTAPRPLPGCPGCPGPSGCVVRSLQAAPGQACSGRHPRARTALATLFYHPPQGMPKGLLRSAGLVHPSEREKAPWRKKGGQGERPKEPTLVGIMPSAPSKPPSLGPTYSCPTPPPTSSGGTNPQHKPTAHTYHTPGAENSDRTVCYKTPSKMLTINPPKIASLGHGHLGTET